MLAISPVYQTAPVGGPPQPDYLNAALIDELNIVAATLDHPAPAGSLWVVIDWGQEVTTALYQLPKGSN